MLNQCYDSKLVNKCRYCLLSIQDERYLNKSARNNLILFR